MNFSTVPPNASICARSSAWYGRTVARTSSGSALSDRAVNPTRSQNRTETTLRSVPGGAAGAVSGLAHSKQNFACSGFSVPQLGHSTARKCREGGRPRQTRVTVR